MGRRIRRGLGSAFALGLLVTSATASAGPQRHVLSQLRVCGHNSVPFRGSGCQRDQSGAALTANELDCSVRVTVPRPTTLHVQFRYDGMLQFQYTEHVGRGSHTRLIGTYFYDTKMPSGGYSCRFAVGSHHLGKSFRSAGPTEALLGPSVCLGAHHVGDDECPRDEGNVPLPATSRITCDAVFARERGRTAAITLLDSHGNVVDFQDDSLGYPITEAGATFTSSASAFAPGSYDCSFAVAGQRADRGFSVSG